MSGRVIVLRGDAAHLPLPDGSIDAVVCDPPYALTELPVAKVTEALTAWLAGDRAYIPKTGAGGFMGREWDKFVPPPAAWDECLRVLKPGGHLLAFAAPRTQDLMGMSIRLAGFEIRDSIPWIFGQGMPKSLDVGKAIDKAAGVTREVIGASPFASRKPHGTWTGEVYGDEPASGIGPNLTAPATEDAARWDGWGTALKPAHEPITVARKPFPGPVAANVLTHGTGALNIAACQVGTEPRVNNAGGGSSLQRVSRVEQGYRPTRRPTSRNEASEVAGRWPPNVIFSHCPRVFRSARARSVATTEPGELAGAREASRTSVPTPGPASRTGGCMATPRRRCGTARPAARSPNWTPRAACSPRARTRPGADQTSSATPTVTYATGRCQCVGGVRGHWRCVPLLPMLPL